MPIALTSLIAGLVSGTEPADDLAREPPSTNQPR
jgi:hypothetical protein